MVGGWWRNLDRILRGEATRPSMLSRGTIDVSVGGLTVVLVILTMSYGASMEAFALFRPTGATALQSIASTFKVPALFALTLVVTLPSLYVFNALVGSRLTVDVTLRLLVASVGAQGILRRGYHPLIARAPKHRWLLWIWILLYAFVGIQMGWNLRPFIGTPDEPARFFREGPWENAYVEVAQILWEAIAIRPSGR